MNQNFIPADKVLYEMRRAAMADFMRWGKGDAKRKWIADDAFWDEIHGIARKCKGEGERKRWQFGLKDLGHTRKRFIEWGRTDDGEPWNPKSYAEMLKSCSEDFYQKILWREKMERIGASLIREGENEWEVENWVATQISMNKEIQWEDWKRKLLGIEEFEEEEENPFLQRSTIEEQGGNLFTLKKDYVYVHCIAQDARMGAGIALQFRNKYPRMQAYIKSKKPKIGDIVVYYASRAKGDSEDRIIVNLVTKEKSWDKPTYNDLENALIKLEEWQRETEDQGNRHLGMPRIGSGLDQLNWNKVLEMINEIFYYNDVVITIKDGK